MLNKNLSGHVDTAKSAIHDLYLYFIEKAYLRKVDLLKSIVTENGYVEHFKLGDTDIIIEKYFMRESVFYIVILDRYWYRISVPHHTPYSCYEPIIFTMGYCADDRKQLKKESSWEVPAQNKKAEVDETWIRRDLENMIDTINDILNVVKEIQKDTEKKQ